MLHSTSVVLLLSFFSVVSPNSTALHRRKRYLAFPPKANFVMTLALLKGIPYDIKVSPTTKVITTYEIDVLFPLPRYPSPFRLATATASATRHRRQLHGQIEDLLDMNGIDGRACVQASICQVKYRRTNNVENLAEDLLRVVFGQISDDGGEELGEKVCTHSVYDRCTISIIDIVLEWAQHVYIELSKQIN